MYPSESYKYYEENNPYYQQNITPKPSYQYFDSNITVIPYSDSSKKYDTLESKITEFIQPDAEERQSESIIFGVPVANFGVSLFYNMLFFKGNYCLKTNLS